MRGTKAKRLRKLAYIMSSVKADFMVRDSKTGIVSHPTGGYKAVYRDLKKLR